MRTWQTGGVHVRISSIDGLLLRVRTLARALGVTDRVIKRRTLFLVDRTRMHLDRGVGLGEFVELEVVLRDVEPAAHGAAQARPLLDRLQIEPSQLVSGAYIDLLRAPGPPDSTAQSPP